MGGTGISAGDRFVLRGRSIYQTQIFSYNKKVSFMNQTPSLIYGRFSELSFL
jgi:hypothetical protein